MTTDNTTAPEAESRTEAAWLDLGREANNEILALADLLQKEINERDTTGDCMYIANGILARIKELSSVVYDAFCCDHTEREDLSKMTMRLDGGPGR